MSNFWEATDDKKHIAEGSKFDVKYLGFVFFFLFFDWLDSFHMDEIHTKLFTDNYIAVFLLKY